MFPFKRQSNRKWEKRPQLYRGRFAHLRWLATVAVAVLAVSFVISSFLYFRDSDTLYVKHVEVLGDLKHVDKNEVVRLSGIGNRDKLFSVGLKTVTKNVESYPWIAEARVRREFPDTIQIFVREREPVALLECGALYYVDAEGEAFKALASDEDADFPVITGFEQSFATLYPQVSRLYLKYAVTFLGYLSRQDFYKANPISQMRFDPVAGLTIYTLQDPLEIYYGRDDLEKKHQKFENLIASGRFDPSRIARVDLDASGKIVVRAYAPGADKGFAFVSSSPASGGKTETRRP